ncbi:phage tail tape measure protein [uncultured Lactobacillus sp.]|uniref:phage tail tape measure protein n=1 Tax=uncultured Lactobacillus sp. TaxID=153152 RepID=UPI0025DEB716|nr:phage tail tape measure protein [uncultured Lactobacillus sp.]
MSGKIPVGGMETDITLDGSQPVRTLKELRQAVTNSTTALKAQVAQLKASGQSAEIAKAKYDGLKNSIDKQKEYIVGLTREQKHLVDAQKNVDRSTKDGKIEFGKYGEQIAKNEGQIKRAETRLASLTSQQNKAKSSVEYYRSGLASLQKEYKSTTEVTKNYVARLKAEHNEFQASKVQMRSYKSSLTNLNEQLTKQRIELKRVADESGKNSEAYRKQENRVNKTGKSLADLKNNQKAVRAEFNKFHPTGISVADRGITKLRQSTSKLSTALKSSLAKVKTAAVGATAVVASLGVFAVNGAKEAGSLQKVYTENTNLLVTSGEKLRDVTKEVTGMQKDGRKYSIQYAESQQNIANGYQELIKRGYTGRQSLGAMKAILQASKASGDSFADTMQVTTSTLEAFGMRTKSTAGMLQNTRIVANKLAMAADATATDFKSLGIGMNYVGTSAKTAGITLTQTASAMGVLSNSGLEAQQAGTGLRKILISLQTPSKSGAEAFKKFGLSVNDFKDKSGKLKPIATIFKQIADAVPKADRSNFFHNVFGTTGQNAAAILATNTKELREVNKQVAGAYKNDYVGKLAQKNMKATKNQEKQFHEAVDAIRIDIGSAMMPALSKASTALVKAFNKPETVKGLKEISAGIGKVANKVADFITWLGKGNNVNKVTNIGKHLLEAFAGWKLLKGIVSVKRTLSDLFTGILVGKRNQDQYNAALLTTNKLIKDNIAAQQVMNKTENGGSSTLGVGTSVLENVGKKDAEKYVSGVSKNILNSKGKVKFSALFKYGTQAAEDAGAVSGLGWVRKLVGKIGNARVLGKSKWMSIFHPATTAAEDIGAASGKGLIGRLLPITAKGFGKVALGATAAFAAIDIFQGLNSGKSKQRQHAQGQAAGMSIGAGLGAAISSVIPGIGTVAGGILGASLGKAFADYAPKIFSALRHQSDSFVHYWNKSFVPGLQSGLSSVVKNAQNLFSGFTNGHKAANSSSWWAQLGAYWNNVGTSKKDQEKAAKGLQKGWNNFWGGMGNWLNSDYNASKKKKSKKTKLSATDEKVMASAMDVSKKSISNVKSMSKALKEYAKSLGTVKKTIKKNDPSKELNSVSKALSKHEGTWKKLSKDIKPIGDAFKYLATFAKSMAKVDAFKALTKDLPKLEKSLSKSKKGIVSGLKDLNKAFGGKKDGIYSKVKDVAKQFDNLDTKIYHLNKKLDDTTKDFKEIGKVTKQFTNKKNNPFANMAKGLDKFNKTLKTDTKAITKNVNKITKALNGKKGSGLIDKIKSVRKPLNDVNKDISNIAKHIKPISSFVKALSKLSGKNGSISQLDSSIKKLSKTIKKNKFGEQIASQIKKADKAFSNRGKNDFVIQLEKEFKHAESALRKFKSQYQKNWTNLWNGLPKKVANSLKKSRRKQSSGFKSLISSFESNAKDFNSHFNNWLSYLEKVFKNTFEVDIPNYADKGIAKITSAVENATDTLDIADAFHFASGTDWRKRYGVPAVLNDGSDSPETGNREGILNPDGTIEVISGRNVKRRLWPWQDVINAHDMATMFGKAYHFANGTKQVIQTGSDNSKLLKLIDAEIKKHDRRYQDAKDHRDKQDRRRDKKDSAAEKKRAEAKSRAKAQKKELDKLGDRISKALKSGNAAQAKKLTAEFNKLSKKYSASKKAAKKPDKHAGQTLVDQGLLTGASRRIGHSQWISNSLFKKLTTAPKAKKTTSARRRTTTTRRRSSSSSYSLGTSTKSATRKTKTSSKSTTSLARSLSKLKSKTIKVTVKVNGLASVKKLIKAIKKVKGKKPKIKVKVTGTSSLKKLQKSITTTHKRVTYLDKAVKKNKFGKEIAEQADKATKSLKGKGDFSKTFSKMVKDVEKDIKAMKKNATSEFESMEKKIQASMKKIHTGVVKLATSTATGFKNALHKMVGYAGTDMKGTIAQLNRGIKGINKVLSQFGSNSSVIKPVKFARGTVNGALIHDTLAMVNDAEYGPKQEAIIRGNDVLLPQYDKQIVKLQAGDKVLNGDQTLELARSFGLPHFAKGSGVSHSALRKFAEKSLKNFAQAFKSMFTKNVDTKGNNIEKDFTKLSKRSSTHYGEPWSQAMWTVIGDAIGDGIGKGGTREAFLRYAEKTFAGVKYVMGAASKIASDCSGMVSQALKHFGLDIGRTTVAMQNSAGVQYLGKDISKTLPGDLVIFGHGTGAAGHVGIVKDPERDTMFNETPPSARVSRISDDKSMGYGFYRIKGLHNGNSKKDKGPSKRLLALAKKELGSKAIAWIKKHLSETIGSFKITGDIGTRANVLAKALKQLDSHATKNGIAAILGNWSFESTLDPSAVNSSGGASGLGQWLGSRLDSLKAYAKKHHKSWQDAATQLEFALHGDDPIDRATFKSILEGKGSITSLAGRFSAEWERGGYNANHIAGAQQIAPAIKFANGGITDKPAIFGEKGPEMAIPLVPTKATRAWELIGKAIGILSNQSGFNNQQPIADQKEKKEEHEFRQAVLLLLQQLVSKDGSANITLTTPDGRKLWEVVEPFFKDEQRSNQIKQRRGLSGNF